MSQAQTEITGNVVDDTDAAIEFANVILLDQNNDIVIGTITDENGKFILKASKGNYRLLISFLGFDDWKKNISLLNTVSLGKIVLTTSENELEAVTITARKPTLVKKVDRIEFNIGNTILSDGDAWEALKKTPGVAASATGSLQIFGKSGILVMIDDRPVQLSSEELKNMLEGMSASEIKSIEVITNPPAKYDAEGNGIINIVLKEKKSLGYNASVSSRYTQGVFAKFTNGASINHKGEKTTVAANYNLGNGKRNVEENSDINFLNTQGDVFNFWNESSDRTTDYLSHNFRASLDYYLSEKSILGVKIDGSIAPKQETVNKTITNVFDSTNTLDSLFVNNNSTDRDRENLSYNVNFLQNFKKDGQSLSVDFDFVDYNSSRSQGVNTDFFNENQNFERNEFFTSTSEQDIEIYSSKVDYAHPIDSTRSFEVGAKFYNIQTDNALVYLNRDNTTGNLIFDATRSNQFLYSEKVYASYASFEKNFSKLYLKLGLRAEYTETQGNSITLNQVTNNDYFELFPSAFLQYQLKEGSSLGLNYSRRIQRPNYSLLNPFQFFSSPFSFIEGNPFLQPSFSDKFELSYSINNKYFLTLYYTYTDAPFTQLSTQDNASQTFRYNAVNLDKDIIYGVFFMTSFGVTDWWQCYMNFDAYFNEFEFAAPGTDQLVTNGRWVTSPYIWNEFSVSKKHDLSVELTAQYYSPRVQGGFDIQERSEVSIGVKKKLFNKKGSLAIYVADIFDNNKFTLVSDYALQNHIFRENPENQYVRFSFSYRFGNNGIKTRKRKDGTQDEKNRL
ncbi:hypothetical protein IMCC3317_23070 [Kordia antarctica]|uniref:Outer membrane protein beta-barrel domain-containing protein n=1 Tax=Kordia antarctica TaxID=1218801 RepID=A0A7L4ZKF4_9FLAO|nr:hypothetical protein IMCC3317_23070 [Kordia antarctica]